MHNTIPAPPCFSRPPKISLVALFALLAMCANNAQEPATGSVAGRVYNPASDTYVRDAEITVDGASSATLSGEGGYYRIDNLPAGDVTLVLRYTGARTGRFIVNIVPGATARQELTLLAETASAQNARGEIVLLDQFVVIGEREGNAKAIMEQKNSINSKTVMATDTFGYVTGGNMADFLQYMAGITMDFDDEDAQSARIHGLDPRYLGATLDGGALATSSAGGVGATRRFTFDQLSSNNIEAIEVSKINTADQNADASAGTINFRSKSPLDRKRTHFKWETSVNASSKAMRLGSTSGPGDGDHHKILPGGSLDFSTVTLSGKLGLLLTAGQDNKYGKTDTYINDYVYPAVPLEATMPGYPVMRAVTFRSDERITRRSHASLGADWQPLPELRISLRTQWTDTKQDQHQRSLRLYTVVSGLDPSSTHIYFRTDRGYVYVSGASYVRDVEEFIVKPSFTYKKGAFNIDGGVMFSNSRTDMTDLANGHPYSVSARMTNIPIAMSRANTNSTAWNLATHADIYNLENYNNSYANDVRVRPQEMREDVYDGAFNVKWTAPWSVPTSFKA
ncbi:MAG: TonB-dependent receptor, partial [Opitutaceae bacterium]|nr:TonB-dependent receptor [Opitutaceae bacterium]